MSYPTFRFCIHRASDDGEVFVGISDAVQFVADLARLHYLALPAYKRVIPRYVGDAIEQGVREGLTDALEHLQDQTVRL